MTLVPLPAHGIRAIKWSVTDPDEVNRSDWTGRTEINGLAGARWTAVVTVRAGLLAHVQDWRRFFAAARGRKGVFELPATEGEQAGAPSATLAFSHSNPPYTSLDATGASAGTYCPAGGVFDLDGHLYIANTAIIGFLGGASFEFNPPLAAVPATGALLRLRAPMGTMRMVTLGLGWDIDLATYTPFSFTCEESW